MISSPPSKPAPVHPGPTQQIQPSKRSRITSGAYKRRALRQPAGYGSVYGSHYYGTHYYDHESWDDHWDRNRSDNFSTISPSDGSTSAPRPAPRAYDLDIPAGLETAVVRTPGGGVQGSPAALARQTLSELPSGAEKIEVDGRPYYVAGETTYRPRRVVGKTVYDEVPDPRETGTAEDMVGTEEAAGPNPFDVLLSMSRYLAGLESFSVAGLDTQEEMLEDGPVEVTSWKNLHVQRPGRLAADVSGEGLLRNLVYDGSTITIFEPHANRYASLPMPGNIDGMLDELALKYDVVLPVADLIHGDLEDRLQAVAQNGKHVGVAELDGRLCQHLSFSTDLVDWEIWVEQGKKPLPRKIIISYKTFPGTPRYISKMTRWSTSGLFFPGTFDLEIPQDAERVELSPVEEPETERP